MSALVCQEVVELASDHVDDALPPETATAVGGHLETCAGCRAHVAQLRGTVAVLKRLPMPEAPGATASLRAAYRSRA